MQLGMQQMMPTCRQQQSARCLLIQKRRRLLQPRQTDVPSHLAILPRSCQQRTAAPQPQLDLRQQQQHQRLTGLQRQQAKVLSCPLSRLVLSKSTFIRRFAQQQQLQQTLSASLYQG